MKDSHLRSLVKGISWRAVGTLDTIVISYLITGELAWALTIGGVELFTKIFLYYGHERLWARIPFGKGIKAKADAKMKGKYMRDDEALK